MSTLLSRTPPAVGQRDSEPVRRPVWQAALATAACSVVAVLVPLQVLALVGWIASDTSAAALDAVAIGTYGWLLGHGIPLALSAGTGAPVAISLHPLGLLLAVLVVLHAAAARAARASGVETPGALALLVVQACAAYAVIVGGVTALAVATVDGPVRADVPVAALAALVVALGGIGSGAVRGSGLAGSLRSRLPLDIRVALDAGAGAALVLAAGSALVVAASLGAHFSRVVGLVGSLDPGAVGSPLLLVLNLALLPNAAAYALAYSAGPGFALGVGTSVSLGGAAVGPVPGLAVLGAVPEGATPMPYAYAVLLVPLAAGVAAGLLAVRRVPGASAERTALRGCYAGLVAGTITGVLAWVSGGSLGSGRLAELGPIGWLVGAVVAIEVGVIAAVTAWVACPRSAAVSGSASAAPSAPAGSTVAAPATAPGKGSSPSAAASPPPPAQNPDETVVLRAVND